jgi:DNA-binding IclR family transcriptional regulator
VKALEKMAQLLDAFTAHESSWRLRDLERRLQWDKATTYRFLETLAAVGVLDRGDDDLYRIGLVPVELTAVYMSTKPVRRALNERMVNISRKTGLTTQIGVLDGLQVAIVGSAEGSHALRAAAMLGQRLPLHASALGKAILSQMEDSEINSLLPAELTSFTSKTIVSREKLLEQLASVRRSGIADAESEFAEGLFALAIPVPEGTFATAPAGLTSVGAAPSVVSGDQWEMARELLQEASESLFEHQV